MFKPQLKFQKALFTLLLILSAICFVYSLGIMTSLYGLYQSKAMGGIEGSQLFYDMQEYNHTLAIFSIALILVSCAPFVFASHKRRKYYRGNIITSFVQAGLFGAYALTVIVNNISYRSRFITEVDFETWKSMAEIFTFNYSESTFFFDAGFVIAALLLAAVFCIIYNLIWKQKLVKREEQILKGEVDNA